MFGPRKPFQNLRRLHAKAEKPCEPGNATPATAWHVCFMKHANNDSVLHMTWEMPLAVVGVFMSQNLRLHLIYTLHCLHHVQIYPSDA